MNVDQKEHDEYEHAIESPHEDNNADQEESTTPKEQQIEFANEDKVEEPTTPLMTRFLLHMALFIVSPQFLVLTGVVMSVAVIAEGMLCFTTCEANIRVYILSFYCVVFGLMSVGIEFKFRCLEKYCTKILTSSGKGIWYLFLATLCFGSEWWSMLIGVLLICNGMLNSYVGCSPMVGNTFNRKLDSVPTNAENDIDAL
eukprot:CAMPEP_0197057734 /NCGR_PEP_ID=MMETSP1384-20130603/100207_1 /TAXON_ID=29189 /ORGANISM="Ammonia sp." /LENGTH=198 /DNA_ID=CAMNT_0042492257 /DNA_START=59 /DNA_END=651 /DNA_ORIENTATION=+